MMIKPGTQQVRHQRRDLSNFSMNRLHNKLYWSALSTLLKTVQFYTKNGFVCGVLLDIIYEVWKEIPKTTICVKETPGKRKTLRRPAHSKEERASVTKEEQITLFLCKEELQGQQKQLSKWTVTTYVGTSQIQGEKKERKSYHDPTNSIERIRKVDCGHTVVTMLCTSQKKKKKSPHFVQTSSWKM